MAASSSSSIDDVKVKAEVKDDDTEVKVKVEEEVKVKAEVKDDDDTEVKVKTEPSAAASSSSDVKDDGDDDDTKDEKPSTAASSSSSSTTRDTIQCAPRYQVVATTPSSSETEYEIGELFDPRKPVPETMDVCYVDDCVVDKEYTQLSPDECASFASWNGKDAAKPFEYCAIRADGLLIIGDANAFKEIENCKLMIETLDNVGATDHTSEKVDTTSVITFDKEYVQARPLEILAHKAYFTYTWKNSILGVVPRDPAHYCKRFNESLATLKASFVAAWFLGC